MIERKGLTISLVQLPGSEVGVLMDLPVDIGKFNGNRRDETPYRFDRGYPPANAKGDLSGEQYLLLEALANRLPEYNAVMLDSSKVCVEFKNPVVAMRHMATIISTAYNMLGDLGEWTLNEDVCMREAIASYQRSEFNFPPFMLMSKSCPEFAGDHQI